MEDVESGSIPRPAPEPAGRILQAGPIRVLLADGDLRYLRCGGVELVRRIFVTVRDEVWGTVPGRIGNLVVEERESGFLVRFTTVHEGRGVRFRWDATLSAVASLEREPPEVQVRYELLGLAETSFSTNRTGLCVLHPIRGCAGLPCEVEHADGSREAGRFPETIAPDALFTNLAGMSHAPAPGLHVALRFEGEVFECEDQRNWTDGSFKTYCRPLDWPTPYRLETGAEVRQAVTVRITGRRLRERPAEPASTIRPASTTCRPPEIGLRIGPRDADLPPYAIGRLRSLNLAHLRADLAIRDPDPVPRLEVVARLASGLGLPLELGLHLPEPEPGPALSLLRSFLAGQGGPIARLLVYVDGQPVTPGFVVERIRSAFDSREQSPPIGGGTDGNFAELNRAWPPEGLMDVLAYPVSPQVHATDDLSLVENLEALGDTVATARRSAPGVPLAVGPVRFHRRPDPFAKGNAGSNPEPELPDPRQEAALGAAWTLAAIRELSQAGADFVSLYELSGPFGVMDDRGVFPVFHVLAEIGRFAGGNVRCVEVSDPLRETALALSCGERHTVLVGNLTAEPRPLRLAGLDPPGGASWHRRRAGEAIPEARPHPGRSGDIELELAPWDVLVLENERSRS